MTAGGLMRLLPSMRLARAITSRAAPREPTASARLDRRRVALRMK
jgi:hypothetical protein